jgi:hypothetical protein
VWPISASTRARLVRLPEPGTTRAHDRRIGSSRRFAPARVAAPLCFKSSLEAAFPERGLEAHGRIDVEPTVIPLDEFRRTRVLGRLVSEYYGAAA